MQCSAQPRDRILYLTKLFPYPPAVTGDSVYSRGLVEAWASVADLTVICADSGADHRIGKAGIDWRIGGTVRLGRARSVFSRWPLIAWKGATPDYLAELDRMLQIGGWDAIVLDNLGLVHALPRAEAYRKAHPEVRLVYVSHEWEYPSRAGKYRSYRMNPAGRAMAQFDLRKIKYWESALISRCDIVTVITASDLMPFRMIDPSRKYLPMTPGYDGPITHCRQITEATPRRVLMLGGRRAEQKQQVLLDWLSAAYKRLVAEDIEIAIAGDIGDELRQRVLREYPRTRILGYIEDLDSVVAEARIGLIADTVGGGFKLRLLTQVFHRLPIVGLAAAVNGLPTPAGVGYLAAQSLDELVMLTCNVIDDLELLNAVQKRAFRDCARAFSWQERAHTLTAAVRDRKGTVLV